MFMSREGFGAFQIDLKTWRWWLSSIQDVQWKLNIQLHDETREATSESYKTTLVAQSLWAARQASWGWPQRK